jgi:glycosyltransferase involved in cell wall biosynthesis
MCQSLCVTLSFQRRCFLLSSIYYYIKPFLPWNVRMVMRRMRAKRRRAAYSDVWPIDEKAGATPPGWPGWPGGKRFAVVLTHDVEGTRGLNRVESLMKLESDSGFRSSFNFVPEGEYRLSSELRQMVDSGGFEVGVHGLEHDGKLYKSKSSFAGKATRIREYLREWKAAGFRSPLMQHKLEWLHLLGVDYDESTFDTDPFEPQPDAAGTIFPFWVPGPNGSGYVELPYSLPQDFTLYAVLREPNIDIWKRKLDWIASHGGMALLNTHPDYMWFDGNPKGRDEFPVSFYTEFLRYVREKYEGQYWAALPREVSNFYRKEIALPQRNSRKKICMVAHSGYESDNRIRRYAEALVKRGDQVDVIALAEGNAHLGSDVIGGVTLFRVQSRGHKETGKWSYFRQLLRFFVTASVFLTRRHHKLHYDVIHVHNVPDFLVYTAWYPKLTGAKVILDIHDIVPELFASKFPTEIDTSYFRWLKRIEKSSAAFSDHVIISNHLWKDKLLARSVAKEKCSVFVNHVDPAIFYRRARTRTDGKFIIIFRSSFQWHQGLDIAIKAFAFLNLPNTEFHLYGGAGGNMGSELKLLVSRLGLDGKVKFFDGLSLDKIAEVIANADLGVVPKRADSFGNEAYSTKIMEFMSQGVPVVASRTMIESFYFSDSDVHYFVSGDPKSMADAMRRVIENKELRDSLIVAGYEYADKNSWDRKEYLQLIDSMTTESFGSIEPLKSRGVTTTS